MGERISRFGQIQTAKVERWVRVLMSKFDLAGKNRLKNEHRLERFAQAGAFS
jgi:hypothetical protein